MCMYESIPRCSRKFSTRSKKNIFFDVDIVEKKQIEMWFIVICTLIDNENIFSHCFYLLGWFAKVFDRKKSGAYKELNVARDRSTPTR